MQLRSLSAAVALLSSFHLYSMAANAAEGEPVVVTATRTAQTVDDSLASVTVITRQEIELLQVHSVQDLLRGVAGLTIANNGGAGKQTSIYMRGTESDHLLVLVDGIKIGSATSGSAAFQDIPVTQIERIEIVRGPRSSLYGSEAIGGVIQIFTRKGNEGYHPSFSFGTGSYDSDTLQAGASFNDGTHWFNANLSAADTDGFNACSGSLSAGCFTVEPDKDGYRNLSGSLRAGYRFDDKLEIEVNALRSEGKTQFDGGFQNESKTAQQMTGATFRYAPLSAWQMTFTGGQSRDFSDNFKDGVFASRFNTRRDSLSWQNDITLPDTGLLTVGADRQMDRIESTTGYAVKTRGNSALFAQYQRSISVIDMELSARRDDNEQFGMKSTGGLALGTQISDTLRATLSYGTAFKAPTFNELYYPFGFGNSSLRPEESKSIEAGLAGKTQNGHWAINAYQTEVDNLIAYDASIFSVNNLDQARIRGVEAVCGVTVGEWGFNANLTLSDPENRSQGANNGKVLPRRAKAAYRLDADRDYGHYSTGISLRTEGERYDDLANSRRLAGYATVDLRAAYDIAPAWQLQGRIENLLDKGYETVAFYNQPGRGAYVTLRYQP